MDDIQTLGELIDRLDPPGEEDEQSVVSEIKEEGVVLNTMKGLLDAVILEQMTGAISSPTRDVGSDYYGIGMQLLLLTPSRQ